MKSLLTKEKNEMDACRICPRNCKANRAEGKSGYCGVPAGIRAARAALHFWEEPCISGREGSGTVFFSGCNLRCVYCQNHQIAENETGREITVDRLAQIFLELKEKGANNINLVTPSHYVPQIREAIVKAKGQGLNLPIVYNCGGYEGTDALKSLEGFVDIYLTDFKYMDEELAGKYSKAWDYPERAKEALAEMVRQNPQPVFDDKGLMQKGVIVRHLLLPGAVKNARAVVKYVYETYRDQVYLSLMSQYTPLPQVSDISPLNRKVTRREYERLIEYTLELGVVNAYIQEGETARESFIPEFDYEGL
ncbi:MAG: radical SAM protein [Fusicatenibacter sp.]|nr:radical SAM protein [Fusicatenibacter sp.]